ncbi:MAG: VanW family protein [Bacillota bacterium]
MKTGIKIFIAILLIMVVAGVGGYAYLDSYIAKDTFYEGILIDGMPMDGLTLEEGMEELKKSKEDLNSKKIILTVEDYQDADYFILLSDLDLNFNYEEVATEAYGVGRSGNIFQRFAIIRDLQTRPVEFKLTPSVNTKGAENIVERIAQDIDLKPVDAQFSFQSGQFEIIKPVEGKAVDRGSFMKSLENLEEEILEVETMEISVLTIEPEIHEEYYEKINGIIGEFSTSFAGSSAGRSHNIRLSSESFKGMLVMPGQQVSYNKTTGPRQEKLGYREAPVILNGELVPGMGGGVCQTSTTLYNALLLADMKIIERHPHSMPPGYVKRGTDAAVSTGYLDLIFRNDFDYPVMIDSKIDGTRVYFYVYGDKENRDYSVKISTSNIATIPYKVHENLEETLQPGARELVQEGRNGYKVNTFKSIIKNGEATSTEQISHDYYRERDYIYKVGPEKIIQPEVPVDQVKDPEVETPLSEVPQAEEPVQESVPEGEEAEDASDPVEVIPEEAEDASDPVEVIPEEAEDASDSVEVIPEEASEEQ